MGKVNSFETAFLQHLFNNADIPGIGDASGLLGSSADGNLYLALFTADPGETGVVTNECDYTGYARKAVPRTTGGWTVSGNQASNAALLEFAQCTGGSNTATYFAVCKAGTDGVQDILYTGALTNQMNISNGITPQFAIGTVTVTEE